MATTQTMAAQSGKINLAARPIAARYLPKRVMTLWRRGEFKRDDAWVAAMFCYYEHHEWLLYAGITTNFPRGYKVQTSVKSSGMRGGLSLERPPAELYERLQWFLIEGVTFRELALRCGEHGARRTLHRRGKTLARELLRKCRVFVA